MDRKEWGTMQGDAGGIEDDLRWSLFQDERSIASQAWVNASDDDKLFDQEVHHHTLRRVCDARIALAALWTIPLPPLVRVNPVKLMGG